MLQFIQKRCEDRQQVLRTHQKGSSETEGSWHGVAARPSEHGTKARTKIPNIEAI